MLIGDAAACQRQNLAGIHMAMKTGMLAAEATSTRWAQDFAAKPRGYERYRRAGRTTSTGSAQLLASPSADLRMLNSRCADHRGRGVDEMTEAGTRT
jgi:hypothetical protein